ncbi:MAG: SsrA-binding protein SmpB [Bacteroidota bacterium]|nr:SsrA-binding protein SmpB [Bacteroidota bacterium]
MALKTKLEKNVNIQNRKASHEYFFIDKYTAGLALQGTEIKSIRQQKVNFQDAYCYINEGDVFVKSLHIAPYEEGTHYNHDPIRERKLLLKKKEIVKITKALQDQGVTLIPTRLFISDRGFAKLDIAIAKGKKLYDKRDDLKEKDAKRELARMV